MPRCFPPRRKNPPAATLAGATKLTKFLPKSLYRWPHRGLARTILHSIVVRARHIIAADRANQFAAPRCQPLRAHGTIPRGVCLRSRCSRTLQSYPRLLARCDQRRFDSPMRSLRQNRRKLLLRGAFHGSTVIAHPPALEKRGGGRRWPRPRALGVRDWVWRMGEFTWRVCGERGRFCWRGRCGRGRIRVCLWFRKF